MSIHILAKRFDIALRIEMLINIDQLFSVQFPIGTIIKKPLMQGRKYRIEADQLIELTACHS